MNRISKIIIITLIAITSLQARDIIISHLTGTNTAWGSYLQVDNISNSSQEFSVRLFKETSGENTFDYTIDPLGKMLINLSEIEPEAICGIISCDNANVIFRLSYESKIGGGLAEFALSDVTDYNLAFFFSDFSPAIEWKGIALANLGNTQTPAIIYAIGDGVILGQRAITIPARKRIRGLYTEWFPDVDFEDINSIAVTSALQELSGVAISGDLESSKLLFTAGQPLATAIDDQGGGNQGNYDGTWRGVWTSTDYFDESGEVIMYLTETNNTFTGTMDIYETDCGDVFGVPITGTIQGDIYTFEASHTCMGQVSTLEFTQATLTNETHLSGSYTQLVNGLAYDHGTFYLDKDPE